MKMKNPENMKALSDEELEKVDGGWNIFDPMREAVESVAEWTYDNVIRKPGEDLYGAIKGSHLHPGWVAVAQFTRKNRKAKANLLY